MVISSSLPLSGALNIALNGSNANTTSSTVPSGSGNSDDEINNSVNGVSCSRPAAAREYAFVDCSEVYLAGKRTSGIYEIWSDVMIVWLDQSFVFFQASNQSETVPGSLRHGYRRRWLDDPSTSRRFSPTIELFRRLVLVQTRFWRFEPRFLAWQ